MVKHTQTIRRQIAWWMNLDGFIYWSELSPESPQFCYKIQANSNGLLRFLHSRKRKTYALIHFEDAHLANFTRKTTLKIFLKFSSNIFCRISEFWPVPICLSGFKESTWRKKQLFTMSKIRSFKAMVFFQLEYLFFFSTDRVTSTAG